MSYKEFQILMRKAAEKWFIFKNIAVQKKSGYIIDERDNWGKNIIHNDIIALIENQIIVKKSNKKNFPLHTWLHHGLSSQALLFNLVGKLISDKCLDPLIEVLNQEGISTPQNPAAELEFDDREVFNEPRQPTSIDLAIYEKNAKPANLKKGINSVFIECKFTETGFGGCSSFIDSGNCSGANPIKYPYPDMVCYLKKLKMLYWQKMNVFGFDTTDFAQGDICPLANYYQFFREVLFALHLGGSFVLLCDDRNPLFSTSNFNSVWVLLQQAVPDRYKARIARITIQDLVKKN